jgi:hypothetical protein
VIASGGAKQDQAPGLEGWAVVELSELRHRARASEEVSVAHPAQSAGGVVLRGVEVRVGVEVEQPGLVMASADPEVGADADGAVAAEYQGKPAVGVGCGHSLSHIKRHPGDNSRVHRPALIPVRDPAKARNIPIVLGVGSSLAELVVQASGA